MSNDGLSSELQPEPPGPLRSGSRADDGSAMPAEKKTSKRRGFIITIVLLALAFLAAVVLFVLTFIRLEQATEVIEQRDRKITEQVELIDEKQNFGLAMDNLMSVVAEYEGVHVGGLVDLDRYEVWAQQAWKDRWVVLEVRGDIASVNDTAAVLGEALAAAKVNASTNSTGTTMESVTDSLGKGFANSAFDDADALCGQDVAGCVTSDDPYTAHYDAQSDKEPYVNKWLRTGLAYHEYAHVLQFTNPEATAETVKDFTANATADADEFEIMADCFALTYLDGWEVDQTVWVSAYEYWEITGYGYTCNATQEQSIRDWYDAIAFEPRTISQ